MFLFRGLIKRLVLVTVVGFIVRRLLASTDPRAQRIGQTIDRATGGTFTRRSRRARGPAPKYSVG